MKLLIKNGTLVLKDGEVKADLLISDGKIAKIAPQISADCEVIDALGKHVLPGIIDMHVQSIVPSFKPLISSATSFLSRTGGLTFVFVS